MCLSCTLETLTGDASTSTERRLEDIPFPPVTDEMKLLARLRWALYECTTATTGGPMHIFTDDYNVEDSSVEACARYIEENEPYDEARLDWPLVQAISRRMVEVARPVSEGERTTALSLSWGELKLNPAGKIVWAHEA